MILNTNSRPELYTAVNKALINHDDRGLPLRFWFVEVNPGITVGPSPRKTVTINYENIDNHTNRDHGCLLCHDSNGFSKR